MANFIKESFSFTSLRRWGVILLSAFALYMAQVITLQQEAEAICGRKSCACPLCGSGGGWGEGGGGFGSLFGIFKSKKQKDSEPANIKRAVKLGDRAAKIARKGGIKNIEKALGLLEQALEEDPGDYYRWTYMAIDGVSYHLALLYFQQKNFDKALAYLAKAEAVNYDNQYGKLMSYIQSAKAEDQNFQQTMALVSQVSKQPPDIAPTQGQVRKSQEAEKISSLLASLQQSMDVGKNGEIFDSGGPVVMTSQGNSPDTWKAPLFSKGTTDSAPVQTDGSRPPLTGEKLKEILQATGKETPRVTSRQERRTLLDGVALENARLDAKATAAFSLGLELAKAGNFLYSQSYLRQAVELDPNCQPCQKEFARVEEINSDFKLWYEETMLQHFDELFKESFPPTIDDLLLEEILQRSKADYILDALDYGHGSWAASLRYMEHMAQARPDDRKVLAAKNYLQSIAPKLDETESEQ